MLQKSSSRPSFEKYFFSIKIKFAFYFIYFDVYIFTFIIYLLSYLHMTYILITILNTLFKKHFFFLHLENFLLFTLKFKHFLFLITWQISISVCYSTFLSHLKFVFYLRNWIQYSFFFQLPPSNTFFTKIYKSTTQCNFPTNIKTFCSNQLVKPNKWSLNI